MLKGKTKKRIDIVMYEYRCAHIQIAYIFGGSNGVYGIGTNLARKDVYLILKGKIVKIVSVIAIAGRYSGIYDPIVFQNQFIHIAQCSRSIIKSRIVQVVVEQIYAQLKIVFLKGS